LGWVFGEIGTNLAPALVLKVISAPEQERESRLTQSDLYAIDQR